MTTPSPLKPGEAEAFTREQVAKLSSEIAEAERSTHQRIAQFRETYPGEYQSQNRYTAGEMERLRFATQALREHRDSLINALAKIDALKPRVFVIPGGQMQGRR